jgi:hypothetical protein
MHKDVLHYCETCDVCQKSKHDWLGPKGFLQPLKVPKSPFEVISMDFMTGLPKSNGHDAILVIVDKLTKYGMFIPTPTHVTTDEVASLLFKEVYKHFGLPLQMISNRDPHFLSNFWCVLTGYFDTCLAMSTSHHPQTDSVSKRKQPQSLLLSMS